MRHSALFKGVVWSLKFYEYYYLTFLFFRWSGSQAQGKYKFISSFSKRQISKDIFSTSNSSRIRFVFFFSCRVKKFCCFTRTEVRFLNVVWSGKPEGRHISLSLSVSCLSLGRNGARSKWFSSEKPDHNLINAGSPLWAAPSWGSNTRHWFVFHL